MTVEIRVGSACTTAATWERKATIANEGQLHTLIVAWVLIFNPLEGVSSL